MSIIGAKAYEIDQNIIFSDAVIFEEMMKYLHNKYISLYCDRKFEVSLELATIIDEFYNQRAERLRDLEESNTSILKESVDKV